MTTPTVSAAALAQANAFVRSREECRLTAYCDSGGKWTVGWGCTGDGIGPDTVWTQAQADQELADRLLVAAQGVMRLKTRLLTDGQVAPMISFAFNLGVGALAGSSLLQAINDCRWIDAAHLWVAWDHVGKTELIGLLARRYLEAAMFLDATP